MFFDSSPEKLKRLGAMTVFLVLASTSLIVGIQYFESTAQSMRIQLLRDSAEFSYWFNFKLPRDILAAATFGAYGSTAHSSPRATTTAKAKAIPVLLYHGDGDSSHATMPVAVFVDQMRALKSAGWQTITLKEFDAFMKGEATVPEKSFLLTFDDGRTDAFYSADPLLKDLGYTAVMFVITGFSMPDDGDKPTIRFYLSKAELEYMEKSGRWELESHGDQDHRSYEVPGSSSTSATFIGGQRFLSNLFWLPEQGRIETQDEYIARITHDLTVSKRLLESNFNKKVIAYAAPFNDYGNNTQNFPGAKAILSNLIPQLYTYSFYQTAHGDGDLYTYPNPNQHFIKRIEPTNDWTGRDLVAYLEARAPKPLPYTASMTSDGWDSNWGLVKPVEGRLSLHAAPESTGASVYLDGSGDWQNYRITATAELRVGTFSLIARQTEVNKPYTVCAFSQDRIYLERHDGSSLTTAARAPYKPPPIPATWTVSMDVQGNTVTCNAYGVKVRGAISGIPAKGGIGATVWHPVRGTADAKITSLQIDPL